MNDLDRSIFTMALSTPIISSSIELFLFIYFLENLDTNHYTRDIMEPIFRNSIFDFV